MKKKLIYILVGITVTLLLINLIINWTSKKNTPVVNPEARTEVIDSLFNSTISKFNLDSNWVEVVSINSRQYDSLDHVYKIKLPGDLRPTVVLQKLKSDYSNLPVKLISDEKIVNGYTTLNLLSSNQLKLQATFNVDTSLERSHSKFSFVVQDFDRLDNSKQMELYHSVFPFSILLLPSAESDSLLKNISDFRKTYSILIDDGIDEPRYALETDFSKTHLRESVRYIVWNYPVAQLYVINNKSDLFTSAISNYVNDEFHSRKVTLYTLSDFISLPSNIDEAKSLMNFYMQSNKDKMGKIILVPADIFAKLQGELLLAKQKGTKFYSPKELLDLNLKMGKAN